MVIACLVNQTRFVFFVTALFKWLFIAITNVSSTNGSSTPTFNLALAFDSMNRLMSSLLRSRSSANLMSSNFSEIQQIFKYFVLFPEQTFSNLFFKRNIVTKASYLQMLQERLFSLLEIERYIYIYITRIDDNNNSKVRRQLVVINPYRN